LVDDIILYYDAPSKKHQITGDCLGSFAGFLKAFISYVKSFKSACGSHLPDFHEVLCLWIFRKSVEKIQV